MVAAEFFVIAVFGFSEGIYLLNINDMQKQNYRTQLYSFNVIFYRKNLHINDVKTSL
jgi:hypothetical protein